MTITAQYIICNISVVKYMYSLSECCRSVSNSEPLRWNITWIFLQKLFTGTARKKLHLRFPTEFKYHSADSKPLLTFSYS